MNFHIVVLSKDMGNLLPCVRAIFERESDLPSDRIIVVDDGIREPGYGGPIVIDGKPLTTIQGAKPFVYARNANLGIRAAKTDVILLNDDAFLTTPGGFTGLSLLSVNNPRLGLISAAVKGVVCNPRQQDNGKPEIRKISANMAFVCVYLPRHVYETIGYLDERYVEYGSEDTDYCRRVDLTGQFAKVAANTCVVNHAGHSSFRTQTDWQQGMWNNKARFAKKWEEDPAGYEEEIFDLVKPLLSDKEQFLFTPFAAEKAVERMQEQYGKGRWRPEEFEEMLHLVLEENRLAWADAGGGKR